MWQLQKFSLTLFWQKFHESDVFTKENTKELIWRKKMWNKLFSKWFHELFYKCTSIFIFPHCATFVLFFPDPDNKQFTFQFHGHNDSYSQGSSAHDGPPRYSIINFAKLGLRDLTNNQYDWKSVGSYIDGEIVDVSPEFNRYLTLNYTSTHMHARNSRYDPLQIYFY